MFWIILYYTYYTNCILDTKYYVKHLEFYYTQLNIIYIYFNFFQKRQSIDLVASRQTSVLTWVGLGLMSVQFFILARLTWWEYSWDIMEPVTYFVTYGTAMAVYAYYVLTKQVQVNQIYQQTLEHLFRLYCYKNRRKNLLQAYILNMLEIVYNIITGRPVRETTQKWV